MQPVRSARYAPANVSGEGVLHTAAQKGRFAVHRSAQQAALPPRSAKVDPNHRSGFAACNAHMSPLCPKAWRVCSGFTQLPYSKHKHAGRLHGLQIPPCLGPHW